MKQEDGIRFQNLDPFQPAESKMVLGADGIGLGLRPIPWRVQSPGKAEKRFVVNSRRVAFLTIKC